MSHVSFLSSYIINDTYSSLSEDQCLHWLLVRQAITDLILLKFAFSHKFDSIQLKQFVIGILSSYEGRGEIKSSM